MEARAVVLACCALCAGPGGLGRGEDRRRQKIGAMTQELHVRVSVVCVSTNHIRKAFSSSLYSLHGGTYGEPGVRWCPPPLRNQFAALC